jgi:hypothetical protein
MLTASVGKKLQTNFLVFSLWVSATHPYLYNETGLAEHVAQFQTFDSDMRRELVESPIFRIWLREAIRSLPFASNAKNTLAELERVIEEFRKPHCHPILTTEFGTVGVLRDDPDSLIVRAPQKDYTFPDEARREELEQTGPPISSFVQLLDSTLKRVKLAWFEVFRDFPRFVKIVVDLIDYPFTSYSSRELPGIIFLSTDTEPLLLEEDLLHEFGHQVLDNVMELDPLIIESNPDQMFRLPWSGRERGIYGYFHAFYIYVLLAKYYGRIDGRPEREQRRVAERHSEILDGVMRAIPELEAANLFTSRGKHLFLNLKAEVRLMTPKSTG